MCYKKCNDFNILEGIRKIKFFLFFKYYLFGGEFVGALGKGSANYGNIKYAICDTFMHCARNSNYMPN
jgi:hypothetical protein